MEPTTCSDVDMNASSLRPEPNPFSTRFVRPGAIAYRRVDHGTLDELAVDFFGRCGGWAAIIGPHGTGKSTLIASLKEKLAERSQVFAHRFSTTDRKFRELWMEAKHWTQGNVIVVDGYEQMSIYSRWRLGILARRRKTCLLITAHQEYRALNTLWRTSVDEEQAKVIRNVLLSNRPDLLQSHDLEIAWRAARQSHPTDLRETLMSMYDWVEEQKQKRPASLKDSRAV